MIDWTNPAEIPFPVFDEKGKVLDDILHDKLKVLTRRESNETINYLWHHDIDLLCQCLHYRHRHIIEEKPICMMPEGNRCIYNDKGECKTSE